jgi:hypothetical protein
VSDAQASFPSWAVHPPHSGEGAQRKYRRHVLGCGSPPTGVSSTATSSQICSENQEKIILNQRLKIKAPPDSLPPCVADKPRIFHSSAFKRRLTTNASVTPLNLNTRNVNAAGMLGCSTTSVPSARQERRQRPQGALPQPDSCRTLNARRRHS